MNNEVLTCEMNEKGVATVCLNRPEVHNAFNELLISSLRRVFTSLDQNDECRLVVLTGNGRSFCAGADLNWMKSMVNYSRKENYDDSKMMADMFSTLNNFSKPVIAKVNGHALGGGVGLLAVCDYVLASDKAKFGFTEVRLGIVPAVISPYCISKIGQSNARAWFLSGEVFNTDKAIKMNLVHESSSLECLDSRCKEIINSFLRAGPNASKEAKKLISNVTTLPQEEVQEYTLNAICHLRISEEGQDGMKALLNKTDPSWI